MTSEPEPRTTERRRVTRQKSFLRGMIYFNDRRSVLDCLVRDISPYGARLIVSDAVGTPDVLDLHTVPPRDVREAVEAYLDEARVRGFRFVRIIHGRGIGVQRETVRAVLARTPFVQQFRDAPSEAGGWGATIATLSLEPEQ